MVRQSHLIDTVSRASNACVQTKLEISFVASIKVNPLALALPAINRPNLTWSETKKKTDKNFTMNTTFHSLYLTCHADAILSNEQTRFFNVHPTLAAANFAY